METKVTRKSTKTYSFIIIKYMYIYIPKEEMNGTMSGSEASEGRREHPVKFDSDLPLITSRMVLPAQPDVRRRRSWTFKYVALYSCSCYGERFFLQIQTIVRFIYVKSKICWHQMFWSCLRTMIASLARAFCFIGAMDGS